MISLMRIIVWYEKMISDEFLIGGSEIMHINSITKVMKTSSF